jgi:beta-glucosidase
MKSLGTMTIACLMLGSVCARVATGDPQPWLDIKRTADERAALAVKAMSLPEKMSMLHGPGALVFPDVKHYPLPDEAIHAAGYVPGVPRMGIPALFETDASLGVTNPYNTRPGDVATALPAGLALASSFNPPLSFRSGALVGNEAHAKGFDVLLGGGMDLTRDPRNGRNFEYLGEDPLLAGVMAGEAVRGTQSQHVISTLKHFALNAHETKRSLLDARIDRSALRESDLLAFQMAIERGRPGSIMCAYNLVNGVYSCGNPWLLNDVLKRDWGYQGWVMSDWGAVHASADALHGLDQESGEQSDHEVYFAAPLQAALDSGAIPAARIDDMVRRILRSMFAVGVIENPPAKAAIDYQAHAAEALEVARQGIVLLKNDGGILPLSDTLKRIAVIGGQAQIGVLSGGGSAQVTPSNGPSVYIPIGGRGGTGDFRREAFFPSSPLKAMRAAAPTAKFLFDAGNFPADAAALAKDCDVAVVFATRHELEGYDVPNLELPNGQNELIAAVAAANPHTLVVLETGNPAAMPWLENVQGVVAAWYPGQEGGQAIADVLFGAVNPSGRLPITFPVDDAHSMRPQLPNRPNESDARVSVDYDEGADVGYRWYVKHGVKPLFAFGHGLSYSAFDYDSLRVQGGKTLTVSFGVKNVGPRAGADVPQVYLTSAAGQAQFRLLGFQRVVLEAGENTAITLKVDPRILGHYDEQRRRWIVAAGVYQVSLGHSSAELSASGEATVAASVSKDGAAIR